MGKLIVIKADDPDDTLYQKIIQLLDDEQSEVRTLKLNKPLSFKGLTILPYQRQVFRGETEIPLTHLEFSVLLYLAQQPGRVFTKQQIFEAVWNEDCETCHNSVASTIYHLRQKIVPVPRNPVYIQTVIHTGYKFVAPKDEETEA